MVGGDTEAVKQNWTVFLAMGKNVFHLGPIGNGQIPADELYAAYAAAMRKYLPD